jgi:hypothetical protein
LDVESTPARHRFAPLSADRRPDPFRFDVDDLSRVHGTNERLAIGDLGPAVAFYMRLMQNVK